mmetsp:Transcript_27062/g.46336  ORF Transcript_27062/g.46336 Transcript_27062/m.46336 type:complete len:734 (+) Transcript_27062:31-2232(+)
MSDEDDFIRTIDAEDPEDIEDLEDDTKIVVDQGFSFDAEDDPIQNAWDFQAALKQTIDKTAENQTSIDQKIYEQIKRKKRKRSEFKEDSDSSEENDEEEEEDKSDQVNPDEIEEGEEEDEEEGDDDEEEEDDFDDEEDPDGPKTFTDLHLSRVIIKACTKMGYTKPTPIQRRSIPFILSGKDICGSAHTGSGKTAAFMLPVIERLLYRPRRVPLIRVLVLTPTRELAAQCSSMTEKLAQFSDIRTCLVVGGLSNKTQETSLRTRPDIVVATPGRMIDHLRNAQSITLDSVEVLILDEADRLLDMGFTEEVNEIVKCCPKTRQTLLFSATMTKKVMKLASVSLKEPVYVSVNRQLTVASGLKQEFVRIKASKEEERESMLISLCKRTYTQKTIIFVRAKRYAHHLKILFGLLELSAAELHGNLTQTARLEALEQFRDGSVNFLIATDLASRGLDIMGIETVINYNMPKSHSQYIHRVGRTARAGKKGSSCSFVSEEDRPLLKEIIKKASGSVHQRKIPQPLIDKYRTRIIGLANDIERILQEERDERSIRLAEREVNKAENMIQHQDEINSRPRKTWFQSTKEKEESQKRSKVAVFGKEPEKEDENMEDTEEPEEREEYLSKRKFQRKIQHEKEVQKSKRKQQYKKRIKQSLVEQSSNPTIKKQVKAVKAQYKPQKLHSLESYAKPGSKSSSGKPPRKKRKVNAFAGPEKAKKKSGVSEFSAHKFKSKKKYKRR